MPQILELIKHLEIFIVKSNGFTRIASYLKHLFSISLQVHLVFSTGSLNSRSAIMHQKLIERIEGLSKLVHLVLVELSTTATIVSPLLVAFINYFVLGMDDDSFHFDGTFWFPFGVDEAVGFFLAVLFQYVADYATLCCFTPIGCIFIGTCWSIVTFLEDISMDISHLRKKKIENLNKIELAERFRNFVRSHADVEELSTDTFVAENKLIIVLHWKRNTDTEFKVNIEFIVLE